MRSAWVILSLTLFVASAAAALEVSAPAAGATLRGGSVARLTWSADALPADVDEWEAFLSIDGGVHYGFRITPHLDIALRSVTWLVPNVDAGDARLLIRTGDERNERMFVLPLSFAIARDANTHLLRPIAGNKRGESAREGDDPVAGWAEGDRRGTRVAQVMHVDPPVAMQSLHTVSVSDQTSAVVSKSLLVAAQNQTAAAKTTIRRTSFVAKQLDPANVLLVVGRLNI
jgi:hypothetical protein